MVKKGTWPTATQKIARRRRFVTAFPTFAVWPVRACTEAEAMAFQAGRSRAFPEAFRPPTGEWRG